MIKNQISLEKRTLRSAEPDLLANLSEVVAEFVLDTQEGGKHLDASVVDPFEFLLQLFLRLLLQQLVVLLENPQPRVLEGLLQGLCVNPTLPSVWVCLPVPVLKVLRACQVFFQLLRVIAPVLSKLLL